MAAIYVEATRGDDANDGADLSRPVKTLARGRELATEVGDVVVEFSGVLPVNRIERTLEGFVEKRESL